MEKVRLIDDVRDLVRKTNDRIGDRYVINMERLADLEKRCAIIDDLMDDYDGVYYEVKTDDDSKEFEISFACTTFEWCKGDDRVPYLFNTKGGVRFSVGEEESVVITIVIPRIWDYKYHA